MTPKPDRQDQILQGAIEAFAKPGYTLASIKLLAQRAQLTPGLIHYHFPDKQAILEAVVGRIAQDFDQAIAWALRAQMPLDAMLEVLLGVSGVQSAPLFACWQSLCTQAPCLPELSPLLLPLLSHQHASLLSALEVQEHLTQAQAPPAAASLLTLAQGLLLIQQSAPGLLGNQAQRSQLHRAAKGIVFVQKMSGP